MSVRLTDEDRAAIVKAYKAGEELAAIAKRYGVHDSYPGVIARRRGCAHRKPCSSRKRVPVAVESVEPVTIPIPSLAAELGIQSYTKLIPNRSALTSSPIYEASAHREISLPYVSILGPLA